jgi:hypothetical protein
LFYLEAASCGIEEESEIRRKDGVESGPLLLKSSGSSIGITNKLNLVW